MSTNEVQKSDSKSCLTSEVKEAIVGAIVQSGVADTKGVIQVLIQFQGMEESDRMHFYDSVHGMLARGVGKPKTTRGINWSMLDKAITHHKAVKTAHTHEKSRSQKISLLKKRQERSRARLAKRRKLIKTASKSNKTQVVPMTKESSPQSSPSKDALKQMRLARLNKEVLRKKLQSIKSHGKVVKLLKPNGEKVDIISDQNNSSKDEEEFTINVLEGGLKLIHVAGEAVEKMSLNSSQVTLQLGPGSIGVGLDEIESTWCMIVSVVPDEQGQLAGLQEGDCIVSIGGEMIPEGVNAVTIATHLLATLPKPCEVTVLREGKLVSKFPPKSYTAIMNEGPLGFSLEESATGFSIITDIVENGQAENGGLFSHDRIIKIGDVSIERGHGAYDECLKLLRSSSRPFNLVVERDMREIHVMLNEGPLGMSLSEIGGKQCVITSIKNGGQADEVGLDEGDEIVSVGGKSIPQSSSAYDVVVSFLQTLPRPLEMVVVREGY